MRPSVLVVGCGRIAGTFDGRAGAPPASHASAWKAAGARLAACVDRDPARARAMARLHGFGFWSTDLALAMRVARPDAVSVCTPDERHGADAATVLSAPRAPRALFIEKPVCSTPAELRRLRTLAARRRTDVVVDHTRRFDRRYARLRADIASGRLGRLVRADVFYYGGWRHNGAHAVDTLRFLLREPLAFREVFERQPSRHRGDPTLGVRLAAGGADIRLHPFDEARYQVFDFDLKFEDARVRIEDFEARWSLQRRARVGGENVLLPSRWSPGPTPPPLAEAARLLIRRLRGGAASVLAPYGLAEAERTMRVLWAAV